MVIVQVRILEQEETHIVYPMIKMVLVNCFQSVLKKKKKVGGVLLKSLKISCIFCQWLLCIQAPQEQRNDREMDGLGLTK